MGTAEIWALHSQSQPTSPRFRLLNFDHVLYWNVDKAERAMKYPFSRNKSNTKELLCLISTFINLKSTNNAMLGEIFIFSFHSVAFYSWPFFSSSLTVIYSSRPKSILRLLRSKAEKSIQPLSVGMLVTIGGSLKETLSSYRKKHRRKEAGGGGQRWWGRKNINSSRVQPKYSWTFLINHRSRSCCFCRSFMISYAKKFSSIARIKVCQLGW